MFAGKAMTQFERDTMLRTWDLKTRTWETTVRNQLRRHFEREKRVALEKINGRKSRERHARVEALRVEEKIGRPFLGRTSGQWEGLDTKAVDAQSIFDAPTFAASLAADAQEWLNSIMTDFAESEGMALGIEYDDAVGDLAQEVQDQLDALLEIETTTSTDLANALAMGESLGEDIAALADRVAAVFDFAAGFRADMIAATEVIQAANTGKLLAADQAAWVQTKVWVTTVDETTCPECNGLDGEEVGLAQIFSSADGAPPAHPNCRCTLAFSTEPANTGYGSSTDGESDGTTADLSSAVTEWKGATVRPHRNRPRLLLDLSMA